MKKILALALLAAVSVTIYVGCKKGPQDPFISFKSRETRMVGIWKCSSFTIDGVDSLVRTISYSGTAIQKCGIPTFTLTRTKSQVLTLGKDGNWNWTYSLSFDSSIVFQNPGAAPQCKSISLGFSDSVTLVNKGIWEFAGGVGQYNSKELLQLDESTDGVIGNNYEIVECSSKELKLHQAISYDAIKSKLTPSKDSIPAGAHEYDWDFKH